MAPIISGSREVAECCLDFLSLELVASYQRQQSIRPEVAGKRIEAIGFQVGQQLVERYTKERPQGRLFETLDVIKYICKDFWSEIWKKQVDNLKTNHRGTYVLQDVKFRWLTKLSADAPGKEGGEHPTKTSKNSQLAAPYLYFPCGILRGALTNLGHPCTVQADVTALPSCSFTIRLKQQ